MSGRRCRVSEVNISCVKHSSHPPHGSCDGRPYLERIVGFHRKVSQPVRITASEFKAKAKSEHDLQVEICRWCDTVGSPRIQGRYFAVPNGGYRTKRTAAKLKAEGVRSGVPDMIFFGAFGRVLWVEVKRGKAGRLSESQLDFCAELSANGHTVVVVRDLEDFIQKISGFYL
jgi:hypothetical protein